MARRRRARRQEARDRDRRPVRRYVRAEHQAQPPRRRGAGARDPGDARGGTRPAPRSGATPSPVAEGDPDIDARPGGHAGRRHAGRDGRRRGRRRGRSWPAGWTARTSRAPAPSWSRPPATTGRRTPSSPSSSELPDGRDLRADRRRRPRARLPDRDLTQLRWGAGAGSDVGALPGLFLGDLLGPAAAEQPRAGEALHDLPQVLHGVDQVVDVGADASRGSPGPAGCPRRGA